MLIVNISTDVSISLGIIWVMCLNHSISVLMRNIKNLQIDIKFRMTLDKFTWEAYFGNLFAIVWIVRNTKLVAQVGGILMPPMKTLSEVKFLMLVTNVIAT